jgi:ubiquinone/menaquinone biosynthesis C-methylase UbiE
LLLNRLEFALMNNPVRAAIQRHVEVRRMLALGGRMQGGRALEIGCGRGAGTEMILNVLGADSVDAFDLDPRMVALAQKRLARYGSRVRVWVGDATAISTGDSAYEAVVDFGIIHHVPDWRRVLREVHRVLRPGGTFYAEEVLRYWLVHPLVRRLFEHPQDDRFDAVDFEREMKASGLEPIGRREVFRAFAWFAAVKPAAEAPQRILPD